MSADRQRSLAKGRLAREPWAGKFRHGIDLCREERWELGLHQLSEVFNGVRRDDLPSLFYSYLGYGAARCQGRVEQGLRLCQRALRMEFYQPENYLNLARTQLLARNRQGAWESVRRGLEIDPGHPQLVQMAAELGLRRNPVVPFLSRRSLLNRLAGKIRHGLIGKPPQPLERHDEIIATLDEIEA